MSTIVAKTVMDSILDFVAHVNKLADAYYSEHLKNLDKPLCVAEPLSDKWVRINRQELRDGAYKTVSVYCFVCLMDYQTKALGTLKVGDIHKAAGFRVPAKHARGSVLVPESWTCANPYGIAYLPPGKKAG